MNREELIENIIRKIVTGARSAMHSMAMNDPKYAASRGKRPARRLKPMQALRKEQQERMKRNLGIGIERRLSRLKK